MDSCLLIYLKFDHKQIGALQDGQRVALSIQPLERWPDSTPGMRHCVAMRASECLCVALTRAGGGKEEEWCAEVDCRSRVSAGGT